MFHNSVANALDRNRVVAHRNNSCTGFHTMCTGVGKNSCLSHLRLWPAPGLSPVPSSVSAVAQLSWWIVEASVRQIAPEPLMGCQHRSEVPDPHLSRAWWVIIPSVVPIT